MKKKIKYREKKKKIEHITFGASIYSGLTIDELPHRKFAQNNQNPAKISSGLCYGFIFRNFLLLLLLMSLSFVSGRLNKGISTSTCYYTFELFAK